MSIQQQARFLQYRQRLRFLHRQLTLLSRLSSEIRGSIRVSQRQARYHRAIAQPPLSLEVTEKELIQRHQDQAKYRQTSTQVVRHLRGSQVRNTAYQPSRVYAYTKLLRDFN